MKKRTAQYKEGKEAFEQGKDLDDCPYESNHKDDHRLEWMRGFLDYRTLRRLGHVFKKWGKRWP
jgi:hypothetical protein